MNSDHGDFEALRQLIRLKRHEQPPPGYFSRLPDKILDRLERGEGQPGFWEKFLTALAFRPALAYGFSLAAFSALTFSVIYSVKTQPEESAQTPLNNGWRTGASDQAMANQFNGSEPLHAINWMGNPNPSNAEASLPSLFDSGSREHPLRINFASPP
jgi:hypothetical protein